MAKKPAQHTIDLDGKRVLLIKLRYIGDTLSLLPVIENLREKAPGAMVDVMVNKGTEEVLAYHPGIRKLWAYDRFLAKKRALSSISYHIKLIRNLRLETYDYVIDFTHGDRSGFLSFATGAPYRITHHIASRLSRILMNRIVFLDPSKFHIVDYQLEILRTIGINHFNRFPRIYIPDHVRDNVSVMLARSNMARGVPRVAIHPGARKELRRWGTGKFAHIARLVKEEFNASIILLGGPGEAGLVEDVERRMGFDASFRSTQMGLLEMAALMEKCSLFIGNDSAPGHIAASVRCPSITLFGPTFPHQWRPYGPLAEVVFKNVPCCGCPQDVCVRPDSNCMDMIGVEEVWEKVRNSLRLNRGFRA